MSQSMSGAHQGTVSFGEKLAGSQAFKSIFQDGMTLIEDTAAYLDGAGRDESKTLARAASLSYAAESMRLTTRLMQLASWLLLQRAVNEGEMTQAEAAGEKHKVRLSHQDAASAPAVLAALPERLQELVELSLRLQSRILHLDQLINAPTDVAAVPRPGLSAVEAQRERLRVAFQTTPNA